MSKISRKTSLALALAATFALAVPAMAATVQDGVPSATVGAYNTSVANITVADDTTAVSLNNLYINTDSSGAMIGLASDFTVTVQLDGGAQFVSAPSPSLGSALSGWCFFGSTSGGAGTSSFGFTASASSCGGAPIVAGNLIELSGLQVDHVKGLAAVGGTVTGKIIIKNAILGTTLSTSTFTAATSVNPLAYKISGGDTASRIDLAPTGGVAARTVFSTDGTLGGPASEEFDAGLVSVGVDPDTTFSWLSTDSYKLKVTGNFAAFTKTGSAVDLQTGGCAVGGAAIASGVINAAGTEVDFSGADITALTGGTPHLCFTAPGGTTTIDPTAIATSFTATRSGATASGSADALSMEYNGKNATVYTFNPASNSSMQSVLRITNTGTIDGKVTIDGTDDSGAAGPGGSVSFMLPAGKTVQLSAQDLENGGTTNGGTVLTGALGDGAGKWRLKVYGEVSGLEVTNLNRSLSANMFTNMGTPVSGDH